jgi:hypothetical protein
MRLTNILVFIVVSTMISCASQQKDTSTNLEQTPRNASSNSEESELMIYSLPAPLQIPSKLRVIHDKFYPDLLKPISASSTHTNYQKALCLGIYSVDLGYATTYNQGQAAINYLAASVKLADQLNIPALGPNVLQRYKNNIANQDSINRLIISSFAKVNHLLTETNRIADEGLLITGSFIEGIHLATCIYEKDRSQQLAELIGNQKLFLDNVIEILSNSRGRSENDQLLKDLQMLKALYAEVTIEFSGTDSDTTREITEIKVSEDQILKISKEIRRIRNRIIE